MSVLVCVRPFVCRRMYDFPWNGVMPIFIILAFLLVDIMDMNNMMQLLLTF